MQSLRTATLSVAFFALTLSLFNPALAEEDTIEEDPINETLMEGGEQCLRTRNVARTEVLSDQVILFHMRGADIYVNVLPKPCKRLSNEGRFMYETPTSRLCRGDLIKILQASPDAPLRLGQRS